MQTISSSRKQTRTIDMLEKVLLDIPTFNGNTIETGHQLWLPNKQKLKEWCYIGNNSSLSAEEQCYKKTKFKPNY